jgi:hypothetical protein
MIKSFDAVQQFRVLDIPRGSSFTVPFNATPQPESSAASGELCVLQLLGMKVSEPNSNFDRR